MKVENTNKLQLTDIGCNLTHESFSNDYSQVIDRALNQNISKIIITSSNQKNSLQAIKLCNLFPNICYSTVGIHPHEANSFNSDSLSELEILSKNVCVKAIGEMGLDFCRNYTDPIVQQTVFEQQLQLACKLKYPVFLHQRDAHKTFIDILKNFRGSLDKIVVHCFTDSKKALFDYLDLDCYIGITGWICDLARGLHLRELVKNIPSSRLMIETDAPYLLPKDLTNKPRNRRNEPCYLLHIANTICKYYPLDLDQLAKTTHNNAKAFFNI